MADTGMHGNGAEEGVLKRYLLGDLPPDQQEQIEKRLLESDPYFELLLVVEHELMEDYVGGRLREREQFERRLLSTAEQRGDVEFARALTQLAAARRSTESSRALGANWSWASLKDRLVPRRVAAPLALAALGAVVVVGAWMLTASTLHTRIARLESESRAAVIREDELQKQLDHERARLANVDAQLKREQQQRAKLEEQVARAEQHEPASPADQPRGPQSSRPVAVARLQTVTLRRENTRETTATTPQEILIQPSSERVRLQLEISPEQLYPRYRGTLQTAEGQSVSTLTRFRQIQRGLVAIDIAADALPTGDLVLKLNAITPAGHSAYLGGYAFRVRR